MSATLTSIRIRNLALVEDVSWEPAPGLNAVSGETGAGKSVLLGALKLLLGDRADKSLIRSGADQCVVEAAFDLGDSADLDALLVEAGAEACEDGQLLLKRAITPSATRQFVNGSPATIQLLRTIGDRLVDLHGPHDHQSLFAREEQMRLLDAYAGSTGLAGDYARQRLAWTHLVSEKESGEASAQSEAREMDLLRHQVNEIEKAAPDPNEEEPLVGRLLAAGNARRIQELGSAVLEFLSGEGPGLGSGLTNLAKMTRELERLDPTLGFATELQEQIATAASELEHRLSSHLDHLETDPRVLHELEERVNLINDLKRKYGRTLEDVLAFGAEARTRLGALENREARSLTLDDDIAAALAALQATAKKLSAKRNKAAPQLGADIASQLHELGFRQSHFEVSLTERKEFAASGAEEVEFLFSPNPGEEARPLRQIASSGEISRVMLAIKTTLARQDHIPILVFDEIDANVGGDIATKIGGKMRELGRSHQIFCITHLPQVASAAPTHFVVTKDIQDGRSFSNLVRVEALPRDQELARMLGGSGKSALDHARALLKGWKK